MRDNREREEGEEELHPGSWLSSAWLVSRCSDGEVAVACDLPKRNTCDERGRRDERERKREREEEMVRCLRLCLRSSLTEPMALMVGCWAMSCIALTSCRLASSTTTLDSNAYTHHHQQEERRKGGEEERRREVKE